MRFFLHNTVVSRTLSLLHIGLFEITLTFSLIRNLFNQFGNFPNLKKMLLVKRKKNIFDLKEFAIVLSFQKYQKDFR